MRVLTVAAAVSLATSAAQAAINLLGASDVLPPIQVSEAVYNVTATSAAPAVFTITAGQAYQGLANGLAVQLGNVGGGSVPTGFTAATEANQQTYYTVNVNTTNGTYQLAATVGGAAITSTSTGSGVLGIFLNMNDGGAGPGTEYGSGAAFNVSCPTASPGVFTGGYLPNTTPVTLLAQAGSPTAAAPGGFTYGTLYYVINTNQSAGTFQLSATSGGSAINATSAAVATLVASLVPVAQYAIGFGPGSPFLPGYAAVLSLSSTATAATTSVIFEGADDTMNPPGTPGTYSTLASIAGVSAGEVLAEIRKLPQYVRFRVVNGGADTGVGSAYLIGN
jgi:hypothetical protein